MKRSALRGARAIELAAARVGRPIVLWGGGVLLALAIGMLLHAVASAAVETDARRRFDNLARGAQERLDNAIASYARAVRAMAALHAAGGGSAVPDRASFHRYAAALDLPNNYPAIEALTFATRVPDNEREAFVAAMRADRSVDVRGYPDFQIFPAGRRPWYEVVTYQYSASTWRPVHWSRGRYPRRATVAPSSRRGSLSSCPTRCRTTRLACACRCTSGACCRWG
jgi:two-component system sensor histidine kinase/response regulator